jgi:hypothetical protein
MKRSIISAIAILLFVSQNLLSQDQYEDVVYLKNNSVFRGMIVEQVPGKSITIQTASQFTYTFTYEQIERIRKEPRHPFVASSPDDFIVPSIYGTTVYAGMLTGRDKPLSSFAVVRNVDVNAYSTLGLGVGWDTYGNGAMAPLFIDARTSLNKGLAAPFIFTNAGYSLGAFRHRKALDAGGFVLNAGAGFIFRSVAGASVVMQASYHLQRASVTESSVTYVYGTTSYQAIESSRTYHVNREFVMITIGFGF